MPNEIQRIGPYPVERELGRGGMGVVYLGRDPELGRSVAIKVLPEELAQDRERLARFDREAKLLASVSHPNIAGIYGVGEDAGRRYLTLEYVPGENLAERLARGPLPVAEALEVGAQIAAGLAAAHDAGVVHRDLKPGNVRITPEGEVKLLDFGLAKGLVADAAADLDLSPTMTYEASSPGLLLGTAAYMSPEQARGKVVDRRTDLWAFGCLLFECLTGNRVFADETATGILARILEREPSWDLLPDGVPVKVRDLLRRCLEKDRRRRMRDAADAHLEIEEARTELARGLPPGEIPGRARASRWPAALGAGLAGLLAGIGLWAVLASPGSQEASHRPVRLGITVGDDEELTGYPLLAADGQTILYSTRATSPTAEENANRVYVRRLDAFEPRRLTELQDMGYGAFSPDGRWLAAVGTDSADSSKPRLLKFSLTSNEPPLRLADWDPSWQTVIWPTPERLLVTTTSPALVPVAADGSGTGSLIAIDRGGYDGRLMPLSALPGGKHLLATEISWGEGGYTLNAFLVDASSGAARPLLKNASWARWSPSGHLLFTRHDTLFAAPFDLETQALGNPVPILRGLGVDNTYNGAMFSLAANGTLAYEPGGVMGARRWLATVDENGDLAEWSPDRRPINDGPLVSRDGTQVAVTVIPENGFDEVWIADTNSRNLRRLIAEPRADCFPWSFTADHRLLYVCRNAEKRWWGLWSPGGAEAARFLEGSESSFLIALAIFADGSRILYGQFAGEARGQLRVLDRRSNAAGEDEILLRDVLNAKLSPDDAWLAYVTDLTGQREIQVRRVLTVDGRIRLGPERLVTTTPVSTFWWVPGPARGERAIRFQAKDGRVFTVGIGEDRISPPRPVPWMELATRDVVRFDELPDGRLLTLRKGEEEKPRREIRVVLDFADELRRHFAALN